MDGNRRSQVAIPGVRRTFAVVSGRRIPAPGPRLGPGYGRMRRVTTPPPPPGPAGRPPQPDPWQPQPQAPAQPYAQPPYPPQAYPQQAHPLPQQPPYPPQAYPQQAHPQPQLPPYQPPQSQSPLPPYQPPQGAPGPGAAPAAQWQSAQAGAEPGRSWVIPVVVVASLVVIVGVFIASALRGEAGGAATQARDAVVRLTTGLAEGDCAGIEAATTSAYFRDMDMTCEDFAENADWIESVGMSFHVGEATVDGSTARVALRIVVTEQPDQGRAGTLTVVRTGGSWRVAGETID